MNKMVDLNSTFPQTRKVREAKIIDTVGSVLQYALLLCLIVIAVCIWIFAPVGIDGQSMENSFFHGDTVAVEKVFSSADRGDVVVLKSGDGYVIKRVVATEGDRVGFVVDEYGAVSLFVDTGSGFKEKSEPYIKEQMTYRTSVFTKITPFDSVEALTANGGLLLPKNGLYVLGDNRNFSGDSRSHGIYYEKDVFGVVVSKLNENSFLHGLFSLFYEEV